MNHDVNSSKSLTTCGTQKDDELRIRRIERNHQKLFDLYAIRYHDLMYGYCRQYHEEMLLLYV